MAINKLIPIAVILIVAMGGYYLSKNYRAIFGEVATPPPKDVCGECHDRLPSKSLYGMVHELPPGGEDHFLHIKAGVKCWECHTKVKPGEKLTAEELYRQCLQCHNMTEGIFHDIFAENVTDCRECHSGWIKGAPTVRVNLTIDQLCDECHGEGYLYEVLPVNCTLRIHIPLLGCPEYCHSGTRHEEWLRFTGNTTVCLDCHNPQRMPFHDMVSERNIKCTKCHSFGEPIIVNPTFTCFSCHPEKIAEEVTSKGYHVIHTKLTKCSSCHHGNTHEEWFRSASRVEACIGCHNTSDLPLHDNLRAGTLCVKCHSQWLVSQFPEYKIPCEGCHGKGFVDPVVYKGIHGVHASKFKCNRCHSERSHLKWFISTDDPKKCLECHTVKGETPGYPSQPPPNHEIYVNATKGNCFICHTDWISHEEFQVKSAMVLALALPTITAGIRRGRRSKN